MDKKTQKSGDNSTNIQAENVQINNGISYTDVKEIVMDISNDVFKSNFIKLRDLAAETASARATFITEEFLKKMSSENPAFINKFKDPGFQDTFFNAQKEYAKSGKKELGDILTNLLVDKAKQKNEQLIDIVLSESISIAPKLTEEQLNILSVLFLMKNVKLGAQFLPGLIHFFDKYLKPFANSISAKYSCYSHLNYAGCIRISIGETNFFNAIFQQYSGLFSKGFTSEELISRNILFQEIPLLIHCFTDNTKLQLLDIKEDYFLNLYKEIGLTVDITDFRRTFSELLALHNTYLMSEKEMSNYLNTELPYIKTISDIWQNSQMKNSDLTSVGIALGHANLKKYNNDFPDLSVFLN